MATRRRAARQGVSYQESDSDVDIEEEDDDFSEDDDESPPPQSRPTRRKAKLPANTSAPVRTRRQPRKAYAEDFSDEDNDDDFSGDDEDYGDDDVGGARSVRPRPVVNRGRGRPSRKPASNTASPRKPSRRSIFPESSPPLTVSRTRRAVEAPKRKGPSQADLWFMGKRCSWTSLPFEILRDILSYASYPLFDERGQATVHVTWLLRFRRIHPALHEAAMAALYFTPPITNAAMGHGLLSLLSQPEGRTTNYNVKVRHLELEARSTLGYSAGVELGALDLGALVRLLPQLIGIDIWTIMNDPKIRRIHREWRPPSYSDSLFEALAEGKQRLRHFHWDSQFMGKHSKEPLQMYQWMHTIHQLPSFQSLAYIKLTGFFGDSNARTDLAFPVNYATPDTALTVAQQSKEAIRLEKREKQRMEDEALANALCSLPNLRKIDFSNCSVVDGEWLQLLPKTLTHLGIIECDRLTTEGFHEFLGSHGQNLEILVLNLNPEIKLSFLTTLANDCPGLQELSMDLTALRKPDAGEVAATGDEGHLLEPDERPTWPKTLRSLHMEHLQHWTSAAAELFFTSLIESAKGLPDLRSIILSVSLDVSWRDRAKIRDMWVDRFHRVFLRKATPPNPNWWSIRAYHEWKAKKVASVVISPPNPSRIADLTEALEETATDDESDVPIRNGKRKAPAEAPTRRLRPRRNASDASEDADKPVSALGSSLRDMVVQTLEGLHIQGMCDEVDVRIDNLRPREEQFHESDFLDSELSGDEEWNGVDIDDEELYENQRKKKRKWRGPLP